jgi:acetyl-CoA acyltransferase
MDAVIAATRAIKAGEIDLAIAGGVESMSRAPFVMPKADHAFSRTPEVFDSTIGWRFVNLVMEAQYGVDSMPETAENVAETFGISRADQDAFALRSQKRAIKARDRLRQEIVVVKIAPRKGPSVLFEEDEHPRETSAAKLAALNAPFRKGGSVTAGNASGVNDGAAALIIASEVAVKRNDLTPIARILGGATAGLAPRLMGYGPVPATQKLCSRLGLASSDFDVIELNEAFASQALAVLRGLGVPDDAAYVNPNGGAIALGHPLGMSGSRLIGTAALELKNTEKQLALATMCIGVGQGISIALERVWRGSMDLLPEDCVLVVNPEQGYVRTNLLAGFVRINNLPDSILDFSYWYIPNPVSFRYFKTSPEIIQLAVMLYVRFPQIHSKNLPIVFIILFLEKTW